MDRTDVGDAAISPARERAIVLALAAMQFTSIVDFMIVMPLGPQLMRDLTLSPTRFGLIVSSYTFAAGAAGLLATMWIDRFDRRTAFLWLYAGFLVGTLLCGLAPSYPTLLGARIVTGAFGGILGGLALAIIGDVFPDERRGRATGALMSAFALASVAGVPFGLYLGTRFDWHAPFLLLAALGLPTMLVATRALPPLRKHLDRRSTDHPLARLVGTLTEPNHLRAFALIVTLMLGGFAVIPYISASFVRNVGVTEARLPWVFVAGGAVTMIAAPAIGWLSDRFGKLMVYRVVAPISAAMMLIVTNLPAGAGLGVAAASVAGLMSTNAGRMICALAMVTGSVEPRRRGGFMSANSSVQHMATGLGAYLGGQILVEGPGGTLENFPTVGLIGASATILSLWLAGRLRPAAGPAIATTPAFSLGAADEALGNPGDPIPAIEST